MSNYEMNIYGTIEEEDLKNIGKYLQMVNCSDSLIVTLSESEKNQKKVIHELLVNNKIIIGEEINKGGLYKVKGIKEKYFNE